MQSPVDSTSVTPSTPVASAKTPAADAAPASSPGLTVVRPTAPRPAPAVDDRVAADLRARVGAASWATDPRLCHELRSWQQARDYAPAEAASQLGAPHVTSETFARLRQFAKPTGQGAHWPELLAIHIDREVARQATSTAQTPAAAALGAAPATVTSSPSATTTTTTTGPLSSTELDLLACRIENEMTAKTSGRRTAETAEMLRAAALRARASLTTPTRERVGCKMHGIGSLAYLLADHDIGDGVKPQARARARSKWYSRLAAYVPLLTMVDALARSEGPTKSAAAAVVTTVPPAPPAPVASASKPPAPMMLAVTPATIKGRPVLQSDGRVLVTFETTCSVGPGHHMWDAVRTVMNAP